MLREINRTVADRRNFCLDSYVTCAGHFAEYESGFGSRGISL